MNDVVAAQKDRQAQIARAEAEKNAAILRAEGEARTRELDQEHVRERVIEWERLIPKALRGSLLERRLISSAEARARERG